MKTHPDSPVKHSEVIIDKHLRAYVIRDGIRYRTTSKVIEVKPRKFQRWIELAQPID